MAERTYKTETSEWHYFDSTEEMEAVKPATVEKAWPAQAPVGDKPEIKAGYLEKRKST